MSLGGSRLGSSIDLELGQSSNATVSLNDTATRALARKTTVGSQISLTDVYSQYYFYLTGSTTTIQQSYTTVSGQGGPDNGGNSTPYTAIAPNNLAGGYRTGDIVYPNSGNYFTELDPNNFTQLASLFTDLSTGAGSAAFSNVTWGSSSGSIQYFTAVLNSGYHFYSQQDTNTGAYAGGNARNFGNPGVTYTFYMDSVNTGIGSGGTPPTIYGAGSSRISVFLNEGMYWINNTTYQGQVYIIANISAGSAKMTNWRANVDGVVYGQTNNGQGVNSFSGTMGPFTVVPNSFVAFETYFWGQGNFTNASYIAGGGTVQFGYNVVHV